MKAGMSLVPGLNKLSLMNSRIIQRQVHPCLGLWKLSLQLGKKGQKLDWSFPRVRPRVDLASTGIERRKQVQGTYTLVLVFQTNWLAWSIRQRWGLLHTEKDTLYPSLDPQS